MKRSWSHSGHEWLHVLVGELRLVLGTNDTTLRPGEVAEFDTSTPHWLGPAHAEAVEILHLFGPHRDQPVNRTNHGAPGTGHPGRPVGARVMTGSPRLLPARRAGETRDDRAVNATWPTVSRAAAAGNRSIVLPGRGVAGHRPVHALRPPPPSVSRRGLPRLRSDTAAVRVLFRSWR
ncbi:cupin domain-containing protein [Streptomyces bobili]|uniref:cupin domain-containing protein n=1 Tax=Streptomyces bobili TaxID=67280 RepID=UPI00371F24B1